MKYIYPTLESSYNDYIDVEKFESFNDFTEKYGKGDIYQRYLGYAGDITYFWNINEILPFGYCIPNHNIMETGRIRYRVLKNRT